MRPLGIGLIVLGIVLLVMGIRETDSFASDVSRFFTGNPTDRAVWLMIGGIASLIIGATTTLLPSRVTKV